MDASNPAKLVGHGLAAVLGLASLVGGGAAFLADMTPVLPVTLIVVGVLSMLLALRSLQGSRAAWSFLVALECVLFVCTFFGAPKVRSVLDISIWAALVFPLLLGVASVLVISSYRDYETTAG